MDSSKELTIAELASHLQAALSNPLKNVLDQRVPRGYEPRVVLVDDGNHKIRRKRKTASADNWIGECDQILIRFEPRASSESEPVREAPRSTSGESVVAPRTGTDFFTELIVALDRAEHRRGYDFVSLKWFRDTALLGESFEWAKSASTRHQVLSDAIESRLILTNKVPNPKSAQFPVTAIRLNRLMPEVRKALGAGAGDSDLDFHPIEIRGEPLSTTILRERR